jgi:cell division protein FtsL
MLHAKWLVHYVPFALFLGVLGLVYIANGHYADTTIRQISDAGREMKQLQYEYKTLQAEWMYRSKESELARVVETIGLKKTTEPPVKIKVSK